MDDGEDDGTHTPKLCPSQKRRLYTQPEEYIKVFTYDSVGKEGLSHIIATFGPTTVH